jgi:hypothetical protein
VFPVKYELGFHIPEDILRSHRRENLKSYTIEVVRMRHEGVWGSGCIDTRFLDVITS